MNREIKFRMWDFNSGKFYTDGFSIDMDGWSWHDDNDNSHRLDGSYDLQQFTGLLDKNGKEIYEGDVIAVLNRKRKAKKEPTYITTIVYKWCGFTLLHNDTYFTDSACINKMCEVIGNIYEHPQLLTQTI